MENETQTHPQTFTEKRGGAKLGGVHIGMLLASTVLLTLAGVLLIMHYEILGILTMVAGIAVRYVDTRL